jgi:polar amino acid transport system substrate-binding protein
MQHGVQATHKQTPPTCQAARVSCRTARAGLVAVNKVRRRKYGRGQSHHDREFVRRDQIAVGMAKDNPDLVKALRDGMTAMRASGAEKAIYERNHVDLA